MKSFPQFKQIAFVVEDLDEAVRSFHANFGIGPWRAWSLGPHNLRDMVYAGAPAEFTFRHALAWQNEQVQFELVQPAAVAARDTNPAVSPDGKWIAFASSRELMGDYANGRIFGVLDFSQKRL